MICHPCREQRHDRCKGVVKGGSWCDCQHRRLGPTPPATGPPGD